MQAPKAYHAERNPDRSRLIFIIVAALIVIAATAVGAGFIMSGGDDDGGAATAGSCQIDTFPALEASHVQALPDDYEYNSVPATSGLHSPQTAIWNLYDQPVPQINYVHNLEHGGMVIQYGSAVPDTVVGQLTDWYQEDTRGIIVAPLAADMEEGDATLADKVVVNSWTHKMTCTTFDAEALDQFKDDYRGPQGDAPEKFPLDSLQQGSN